MSKVTWKGATLLAPLPAVMVSCGDMERSNIITVAWTGIISTHPPKLYISVRPERYSYNIIKESGEFVVNLVSSALLHRADWCGMYSGKKKNKFGEMSFTKEKSEYVSCPAIGESPMSIECRVTDTLSCGSHDMFIADILGVRVDEDLIDINGRLDIRKANLTAFAHGEYFALGKKLGSFGFSVKKKKSHSSSVKHRANYTVKKKTPGNV